MSELNEQMIELTIEALTGTVYDLCVSPFETILGIKMKIQRLEGIPVYQQQLVHGNTELHDEFCLEEYSIGSGAQLKLLLAMRGGPIHAHRVQLEDPTLLEIAEVLEGHDFDHKYTVMLLRDGDTLDMADIVQVVAEESPGHVSPLPQTTSNEQETTSAIALSKVTRNKMQDLMDRLRSRKLTSQTDSDDTGNTGSRQTGPAKVLILDSRTSSRLLHSSAPSPITPHLRDTPTDTKNPSAVHRKLVFPAETTTSSVSEEECPPNQRQHDAAELDKHDLRNRQFRPPPCQQQTLTTGPPARQQTLTAVCPPTEHHTSSSSYAQRQSERQQRHWKRRRRLRRPSCLQDKAQQHSNKDVSGLVKELSQLGLGSERDKGSKRENGDRTLPHLPPIGSTTSPPQHTHRCTVPQLPAISIGHAPCLTGSGRGKGRPRCAQCGKKTGLASTYTCRCGGVFCGLHRYTESHNCSFDYKMHGRETIARNNPLVVAPKLPKL